ncbi:hypothetical protein BKA56DRAFT_616474 [Ilyonectria sp. MPI-CAGE-AT-0026]|nr:hypothetical protein BKA56DRAFT_616474 [Ilyonectria sp. MPI-CAGE-AT-0026]
MSKLITVFGATGGQGGSVARSLLASQASAFKIRATTRRPESKAATALAAAGAEVVKADGHNKGDMVAAFTGAWGAFINTNSDDPSINTEGGPTETDLGKLIVDAASEARVKHLVYSSFASATKASKGQVPNLAFDGCPGEYMENFFIEAIAPIFGGFPYVQDDEGFLTFHVPAWGGNEQVPYLCMNRDYGDIVHGVFLNPEEYDRKFVQAFSEPRTHHDVTNTFEKITGKKSRHTVMERWQDLPTLGLTVLETVKRMHGFCQESNGWYYGSANDNGLASSLKAAGASARGETGEDTKLTTLDKFFRLQVPA